MWIHKEGPVRRNFYESFVRNNWVALCALCGDKQEGTYAPGRLCGKINGYLCAPLPSPRMSLLHVVQVVMILEDTDVSLTQTLQSVSSRHLFPHTEHRYTFMPAK